MTELSRTDIDRRIALLPRARSGDGEARRLLAEAGGGVISALAAQSMRVLEARRWFEAEERLLPHVHAAEDGKPTLEGACRHVAIVSGEDPDRPVPLKDGGSIPAWETFAFAVRHALDHMSLLPPPASDEKQGLGEHPVEVSETLPFPRPVHPDDVDYVVTDDENRSMFEARRSALSSDGDEAEWLRWVAEALEARRKAAREDNIFIHTALDAAKPESGRFQEAARHVSAMLGHDPEEPIESGPYPRRRYMSHCAPARRAAEYIGLVGRIEALRPWLPPLDATEAGQERDVLSTIGVTPGSQN